jgi:hypothetical protein
MVVGWKHPATSMTFSGCDIPQPAFDSALSDGAHNGDYDRENTTQEAGYLETSYDVMTFPGCDIPQSTGDYVLQVGDSVVQNATQVPLKLKTSHNCCDVSKL